MRCMTAWGASRPHAVRMPSRLPYWRKDPLGTFLSSSQPAAFSAVFV